MDAKKLKAKIVEKGLTVAKTAELAGMNKGYLYRKMNCREKFTVGDTIKIKEVLGLTDMEAIDIFLSR